VPGSTPFRVPGLYNSEVETILLVIVFGLLAVTAVLAAALVLRPVPRPVDLSPIVGRLDALERSQERAERAMRDEMAQNRLESQRSLETIRRTVDEQLQGTLEKRLGESFRLVSDRLEQDIKVWARCRRWPPGWAT